MKDLNEPQEMHTACVFYLPSIQRLSETCDFWDPISGCTYLTHTSTKQTPLPSQFRHDFLDQYLLNISKTEHAIGQASSARHFPLVISMTSPLLFPLLAIFSEHFTTQILNTKVKKSPFLLQSYCNPSSHAEISNLGCFFFLWIILYTYDSRNTLKYLFLSLI